MKLHEKYNQITKSVTMTERSVTMNMMDDLKQLNDVAQTEQPLKEQQNEQAQETDTGTGCDDFYEDTRGERDVFRPPTRGIEDDG